MNVYGHLRILIVEDDPTDALILRQSLQQQPDLNCELVEVERLREATQALKSIAAAGKEGIGDINGNGRFDAALLDLGLPDSQGVETFAALHRHAPFLPVLVLTGLDDEQVGVKAVRMGAQDYLVKRQINPALLIRALRYAIERQRNAERLVESEKRLHLLAARLQDVREKERTRISREIHDELGQMLTGIKMDLRWIETKLSADSPEAATVDAIRQKLRGAVGLVDDSIVGVQRIAVELRPAVLDQLGLVEAIRDEVRRFESRTNIAVETALPETLAVLDDDTRTTVFRVCQELLTNVARHSGASAVTVGLSVEEGILVLEVVDDGSGFAAEVLSEPTSLGILGMSERASLLGGDLTLSSTPGNGVAAKLRIPLKSKD